MGKPFWKSKTFWTNLGALVAAVGAVATGQVGLTAGIPPIVIAAVNIVLRFITKEPIK